MADPTAGPCRVIRVGAQEDLLELYNDSTQLEQARNAAPDGDMFLDTANGNGTGIIEPDAVQPVDPQLARIRAILERSIGEDVDEATLAEELRRLIRGLISDSSLQRVTYRLATIANPVRTIDSEGEGDPGDDGIRFCKLIGTC